jgi:hypothetical protein
VDWARAREVLGQLNALLAADDVRANTVWRESMPLLTAALGPAAGAVGRDIERFEYDRALHSLRAALGSIGVQEG